MALDVGNEDIVRLLPSLTDGSKEPRKKVGRRTWLGFVARTCPGFVARTCPCVNGPWFMTRNTRFLSSLRSPNLFPPPYAGFFILDFTHLAPKKFLDGSLSVL